MFILLSSSLLTITSQAPFIYHIMLSNHSLSKLFFAKTLLPFLITMQSSSGTNAQDLPSEALVNAKSQSSDVKESRKVYSLLKNSSHLLAYLHIFVVATNSCFVFIMSAAPQLILTFSTSSFASWTLAISKYAQSYNSLSLAILLMINW